MFHIPQHLPELKNREEELSNQLSKINAEERALREAMPLYYKFHDYLSKGGKIRSVVGFITGLVIAYFLWYFELNSFTKFPKIGGILLSLWMGVVLAFIGMVVLDPIVKFIFWITSKGTKDEFVDYMKQRKTQVYKKHLIKSELGIVRLKLKRMNKK